MTGESSTKPLVMQQLRNRLQAHVEKLAGEIGERNVFHPASLAAAADYIEQEWQALGHAVRRQAYPVRDTEAANLEILWPGDTHSDEIVIIGAHYDSAINCPGANDNATGVAALLEISRSLQGKKPARTLRFVAFANEEPPFYRTGEMGSLVYARTCKKQGDNIVAMLCLETLGCYSDRPKSQDYPFPLGVFFPDTANFIGLVSNTRGRHLLRRIKSCFRAHSSFPVQSLAAPDLLPGIGWSDHWSFWQQGFHQTVMVTDTALYRYEHYHTRRDTPDRITYAPFAQVVAGLVHVVADLASG